MDRGLFDPLGVAVAAEFGEVNGGAAVRDAVTSPPPVRSPEAEPDVEDEDEDEAECRVCRGEAEPDRRLFAPCKCSGSIRFTHSDCLEQWLEHSGKTYCELCGHQFEFKPLYDANAPDVLPWSELCGTMLRIAFFKWLPFGVRAALVLVLWLAVAPWCTSWLYRMWLLRASAMINVNFSERFDAPHVVADIFSGIILIVCVVFSFLALMSFADFLRFHLDHIEEHMDDNHANNHAHHHHHHHHHHRNRNREVIPQAVREANERELAAANDVPVLAENARDADPRLQENFNELDGGLRPLGNLDEADSDDSSDEEEWGGRNEQEVHDNLREERPRLFEDAFIDHPLEMGMEHHMEPVLGLRHRRGARNDQVEGANEVIAQANEEPLARAEQAERAEPAEPANAAVPPRRNVRDRPNNAGPRAANANREWEDDFEHMEINIAMDELLGLRGDIVVLFRNVSWLLAFNGAYLGLFAFIPYTLGSTLLSAGANIVAAVPFSFSSSLLALIAATSDDETAMGAVDSKNIDTSMPIFSFTIQTLWRVVEGAKARGDCLQLVDICTCATGYFAICCTIVLWRFMVTTASSYIHRPLMGGLLWALRCLTAIVKVSTLLLLKMVVLPIVLGLGIDFATLHLFKVTPHERVAFCLNQMVGSLMVHWVLGITFMLFVTVAVLQLREVVHPDLLAKVIRPQEDHPDLLRTLLSEKCTKHARRMVLSLAIYAALLVVIVHIPVRLACLAAPSLLPLTLRFQYLSPEIQVPLELLAVHLVVLSVLEHAKNDIGKFQHSAIAFASKHFGLTGYLLPRIYMERTVRDPTLNIRRRVREEFVLAPPPLHFHPRAQLPPEELRVDGQRYLPWPEEGLDDPEPTEYDLLPRRKPTNLSLRLSGLVLFSWAVSVLVVGAFLFGSLAVGRLCLAPFERVTGISHDPLVMAAGVEIVWLAVNGVQALQVLTRPIDQVAPDLVQRGYAIRNLTPSNAVTSVIGWAFASPLLLGHSLSKCFPTAQSSLLESYMMGILLLNLTCWLVCTVRNRRRGAGRRDGNDRRNANMEFDDAFIPDEDEEMEMDEDFLDDEDDEDLFDDEDDAEDEDEALAHDAVGDGVVHVDRDNFVKCLRKSYRQLRFTLAVHESEVLRMRQDPIGDNCFDVGFFQDRVLWPIVAFLFGMLIAPTFASSLVVLIVGPSPGSKLEQTAFAMSALVLGATYLLVRAHAFVSRWIANVCESIRNERYLIGRQLQDMAR